MTSASDRPSITSLTSILDNAQKDRVTELLDFTNYVPRRARSEGGDDAAANDKTLSVKDSTKTVDVNPSLTEDLKDGAVSEPDFELMTKAVNAACAMLKHLGKRNEELSSSAEGTIAALKTQLAVEKDRSNKLQRELDAARADKDRLADESQTRIKQLESLNASLTEKLEEATRELESARPWLEYLSSQIHTELQAAISQAERVISTPSPLAN
jgi:chromosome segregation ATPase